MPGRVARLATTPEPIRQRWARIELHAPVFAATCHDYLAQISVSARPATVHTVDRCLRLFADWLIDHDPNVLAFRQINRRHIEHYKLLLATRERGRVRSGGVGGHVDWRFSILVILSGMKIQADRHAMRTTASTVNLGQNTWHQ